MTARVTKEGLLIPREMLGEMEEVEIHRTDNCIVISPTTGSDPILQLGKHPSEIDIVDGSTNHDDYIYSSE